MMSMSALGNDVGSSSRPFIQSAEFSLSWRNKLRVNNYLGRVRDRISTEIVPYVTASKILSVPRQNVTYFPLL